MTCATSSCIQYGIWPACDRLIIPVRKARHASDHPRLNGAQLQQLESLRTRRIVLRLERGGYPYRVIAQFAGISPNYVYALCSRSGVRRYRDDYYIRAPRQVKKKEQHLAMAA